MFIHESPHWPVFRWDRDKIDRLEKEAMLRLGYLAGRMSSLGFDSRLSATVETVTNDIVASSSIEGVKLDTDEVRSSVARKFGVQIVNSKEPTHYIDGIVEMTLDATKNHSEPLTEERLFRWHHALFPKGFSGSLELRGGEYRNEEMAVVSGTFGRERVHYRAPEPTLVKGEMDRLLQWINESDNMSQILKAAVAHLWFVSIHPFDDGNGRIGRAIADMILAELDSDNLHFYSFSRQILKDRNHYYKVLEATQRGDCEITQWLEWFINALMAAVADSNSMLSQVLRKAAFWTAFAEINISDRQRMVLNVYLDGYDAKLTAKNWAKVAGVSADTALRDIASLVNAGVLIPTPGRVRDVAYSISYSSKPKTAEAWFSNIKVTSEGQDTFLNAVYKDGTMLSDKLLKTDVLRYESNKLTAEALAMKYFAYLVE